MPIEMQRAARPPRVTFFLLLVLSLLIPGVSRGEDAVGHIAITTPPDQSVVESTLVNLSLRLPPNTIDDLQVIVNNRKLRLPKKRYSLNVCFDGIELSYGINTIRVVGLKQGKKVEEVVSRVFFRSDLSSAASAAPDGWDRYIFHGDHEKACVACHQLDFSAFTDAETTAERSPCYQCHKKVLTNYSRVHGPSAVWSCLSCHDKGASPKLSVVKPDSKVCFNCHEDTWSSMKFAHGPAAAGSCATCHNPHASDQRLFLRASPGDLCAGCHEEILTKPHVLVGFSNNGHPVRKSEDPYHPGKSFSCVSCHNPHASNALYMLQNYDGNTEISNFCRTCHRM